MIPLHGRTVGAALPGPLDREVWRLVEGQPGPGEARIVPPGIDRTTTGLSLIHAAPEGEGEIAEDLTSNPTVWLPPSLEYLQAGDIVRIARDGSRVRVLWRRDASSNSLLLTERCDNLCIMCSQPPKERLDPWLVRHAHEVVALLPPGPHRIGLTGGEPTLLGDDLIDLLGLIGDRHPDASVHLLTNGRAFRDGQRAAQIAQVGLADLMLGIPIYGAEPEAHDRIVNAPGAFDETVRGILRLAQHGVRVEVRVVVQRATAPQLVAIAKFLSRNLPFVDQVAWMGLELMGFARSNRDQVWIDPRLYQQDLADASMHLRRQGITSLIYNHPLCVLPQEVWNHAVPAISDWKNDFLPACQSCGVRDRCGGLFSSGLEAAASFVRPITAEPTDTGPGQVVPMPSRRMAVEG